MAESITIDYNGEEREITMSFGLLNELAKKAGDIDAIPMLAVDSDLRESFLVSLLSKRDKKGRITEEISMFDVEIDPEDVINLLDWAGGQVLDFFVSSLEKAKSRMDQNYGRLKALLPTSTGSPS